jgi:predicted DNA-binding transcriptional regulator YafY
MGVGAPVLAVTPGPLDPQRCYADDLPHADHPAGMRFGAVHAAAERQRATSRGSTALPGSGLGAPVCSRGQFYSARMNRTDRLYALVDELRRVSPRTRSAAWLARQFEVSVRTIERDLDALRTSGVPVWAEQGRGGGYGLDRNRTLPPLALTAEEALAVTVALRSIDGSPFGAAAARAVRKVLAGLPSDVRDAEERLAGQLRQVGPADKPSADGGAIIAAVAHRRVVPLRYVDARGTITERDVEPLSLLRGPAGW